MIKLKFVRRKRIKTRETVPLNTKSRYEIEIRAEFRYFWFIFSAALQFRRAIEQPAL